MISNLYDMKGKIDMKKILSGIIAMTMMFSQQFTVNAETTELSASDQKIIEQVSDQNGDNIKDETDLAQTQYLSLDLTDIDDISILKKAVSLKSLSLYYGKITDFSVLAEIPSLRGIYFTSVPVSDISFVEDLELQWLSLNDTKVPDEEKLKYLMICDLTIPAGHLGSLDLSPRGMIDCEVKIRDSEIIAFGEYGVTDTMENGGIVCAKKPGVTEYDVIYDGKVVKTGKITVSETDTFDPPLSEDIIKVKSIQPDWIKDKLSVCIITEDGTLYTFDGKEYEIVDRNVKEYDSYSSSYGEPLFVLHTDGTMTLDGKNVFDDATKVETMDCSYSTAYIITEERSLWYITYKNGSFTKKKISDDVATFDRSTEIFSTSDTTYYQIISGSARSLGKHDIKTLYQASYRENYLLDSNGTLWLSDKGSKDAIVKVDTDVTAVGYFSKGQDSPKDDIYQKSNGRFYKLSDNNELPNSEGGAILPYDPYYPQSESERSVTFYSADYRDVPQLFEDKEMDSDFTFMLSRASEDKTEYFSFLDFFASVSNVDKTIEAAQNDDMDYIILFTRTDGSLWEYHIGEGRFVRKDFGNAPEEPVVKYSSADLLDLIKYMNGTFENGAEKYDINDDGAVNILDLIKLKEILLTNDSTIC